MANVMEAGGGAVTNTDLLKTLGVTVQSNGAVSGPVTVKPATTPITTSYKPLDTNQKTYLTNYIKTGTDGQAAWARDQLLNVYGVPKKEVDYIIPQKAADAGYGAPVIANSQGLNAAVANGQIQNVGAGTNGAPTGGVSGGSGGGYIVPTGGGITSPGGTIQNTAVLRGAGESPYDNGRMIGDLPTNPEYWTGAQMADNLGLIYDFDKLLGIKQDAVNTQYANLDNEWGRTKDAYYDAVGTNADLLMGTLKRGDMAAARAGTASGTAAASQLSALLGLSQDASVGATDMAQQRADLVSEREAALAKASSDALSEHNNIGTLVGNIINSKYGSESNVTAAAIASLLGLDSTVLTTESNERMNSAQLTSAEKNAATQAAAQVAAAKAASSGYSSGGTSNTSVANEAALASAYTAFEAAKAKGDEAGMQAALDKIYALANITLPNAAAPTAPASTAPKPGGTRTIWEWLNEMGAAASTPSGSSRRE